MQRIQADNFPASSADPNISRGKVMIPITNSNDLFIAGLLRTHSWDSSQLQDYVSAGIYNHKQARAYQYPEAPLDSKPLLFLQLEFAIISVMY